ncbi:MAG: polysaccharide deacetylase family protein [Bacillota bacterium]|nr:polysaccharide deacetylase family protein [Candidatus Fermentithermobacillaceae bacterium]
MVIYLRPATRIRMAAVLSLILVVLGVRAGLSVQSESLETAAKVRPITRVETSLMEVGLIVDVTSGGPDQISACLAALDGMGAKATWFLTATLVEAEEDTVRAIMSGGHEIGIKGTDDKRIDNLPQAEMLDRIQRARQALMKIAAPTAPFFYPPGERYSDALVLLAFQEGYQSLKPGLDLAGMKGKEADAARKMVQRVSPGDILKIRVDKKGVVPAEKYLAALASALGSANLSVVTVSQLFKGVR